MVILHRSRGPVERLATFTIKRVVLVVREVVEDGILVHDTAKKGIHVTYNIVEPLSLML
jgi:hypothetical protein